MKKTICIIIAFIFIFSGAWVFSSFVWGKGKVTQFCPVSFQSRNCMRYEIPFVKIVIRQKEWQYEVPQLFEFLQQQGHLKIVANGSQWLTISHWGKMRRDGHTVFYKLFFAEQDYFIALSEQNVPLAQVVWPKVIHWISQRDQKGLEIAVTLLKQVDWSFKPTEFINWYGKWKQQIVE